MGDFPKEVSIASKLQTVAKRLEELGFEILNNQKQDIKMLERCIRLDLDCTEICEMAIGFIARGSEHAEHILRECAEICNACAEECEKHSRMEHCKRCAEACRVCAEACEAGIII